jgi:hypothetical protein
VHHVHLPGILVVQGLLLLTTPTANAACKVCGREGHNAPAHRGAQLNSQFSSNNHRGDSRGVASVVSLATTRARTRSMQQQQQQQQQSAQQEGSTCVGTARGKLVVKSARVGFANFSASLARLPPTCHFQTVYTVWLRYNTVQNCITVRPRSLLIYTIQQQHF